MDHLSPSSNLNSAAGAAVARDSRYFRPAPLADIISEQLAYLIEHAASSCHANCPDCKRFEQVKRYLLEPFN